MKSQYTLTQKALVGRPFALMAEQQRLGAGRVKGAFSLDAAGFQPIHSRRGRRAAGLPVRKFHGCQIADGGVGAHMVEVLAPDRKLPVDLRHAAEEFDVQALGPEPTVEAFDKGVLRYFMWVVGSGLGRY